MSILSRIEQYLELDLREFAARGKTVKRVRDYYRGIHEDILTPNMRKRLRLAADENIVANWMPLIIHTEASRIRVLSVSADVDAASEWANLVLDANSFDTLQANVHTYTLLDGDCYVMVGYDKAREVPLLSVERAFDGETGVFVIYNGTEIYAAVKIWDVLLRDEGTRRLKPFKRVNLYFEDRIEKYYAQPNDWELTPFIEDGQYIFEFPFIDGVPLGVPVVHFRNRKLGNYGKSEIEDVLALQKMYNRALASWLSAIEAAGFPNRFAKGWNPSGLGALEPGDWIAAAPDGLDKERVVDMQIIQPGDVLQLRDVLRAIARIISNITSTAAPEFFESDSVSADAQEARQSALLLKCHAFQMEAIQSWQRVMDLAWWTAAYYSSNRPPDCKRWIVEFSPIGVRKDSEVVNSAVQAYSTGALSRKAFLEAVRSVFGWTALDIERILQEREADAQMDVALGKKPLEFTEMKMPSPKIPEELDE